MAFLLDTADSADECLLIPAELLIILAYLLYTRSRRWPQINNSAARRPDSARPWLCRHSVKSGPGLQVPFDMCLAGTPAEESFILLVIDAANSDFNLTGSILV